MNFNSFLVVSALVLGSLEASAASIAGKWQGPCENRGAMSVSFVYDISEPDANGAGEIYKTKSYYQDAACAVFDRTNAKPVSYVLGDESADGIYEFDVFHKGSTLFDIVKVSDDGELLVFGEKHALERENRPSVLSTTKRVFVKIAE